MRKTLDIVGFINYCYKNGYNTIEIKEDKEGSKNGVIFLGKNIVNFGFSEVDKCPDVYNTSIVHSLKLPMDSILNLNNFKNRYERNESFISFIHGYKNKIDYYSLHRSCGKYNVRMSCSYCSKADTDFYVDLDKKEINNVEELVEALKDTHGIDKIIFSDIGISPKNDGKIRIKLHYDSYNEFWGIQIFKGMCNLGIYNASVFSTKRNDGYYLLLNLGLEKYEIGKEYKEHENKRFNFGNHIKKDIYLNGEVEEAVFTITHRKYECE